MLNFDSATGYLLGEANRGLNAMFTYINESRLAVSQQAQAHAEASFQGAWPMPGTACRCAPHPACAVTSQPTRSSAMPMYGACC